MAAAASRGTKKKHLLPDRLQARLINGTHKLLGAGLILTALLGWAALMTWSAMDPSLSRAVDGPVANLGGKTGAIFSDILFQSFGLASIILILPIAVLGFHLLLNNRVSHFRWRLISWPFSIAILATALTLLPVAGTWPLPQSYGGIIGDTIARIFALTNLSQGAPLIGVVLFLLIAALSILALSFTTSIHIRETKVLLNVESPAELKALITSPYNRLAYWWAATRAQKSYERENTNHRKWWRNANLDDAAMPPAGAASGRQQTTTDGKPHGFRIHPPHAVMPRPHRPDEAPAQTGHNKLPPMSAKPMSAMPLQANAFEPVAGGLGNANPRIGEAGRKAASPENEDGAAFILPPIELLTEAPTAPALTYAHDELSELALMLENVLADFGIKGDILNVRPGPVVTLFEFEPARGIKTSRIIGLADDIARSMSALSARIAVIPGRTVIGIELPNQSRETVYLRELVEQQAFLYSEDSLPLILGKSIGGEPVIEDIAAMPHLLIAGTTGSGKSVGINTMLLSLLYRLSPEQCRMILIDPKMLELSIYDGIPHLLTPVVTDPMKALSALKWAVREMENRYRQMSKLGVRNIEGFNERVEKAQTTGEALTRTVQTGFNEQTGRAVFEEETMSFEPLPKIVIVIDEMADLMMVAGKEIEIAVQRLAQMARAAGIHLIMATQRPSVDVITGTIKANFPTRISFQVTSKIDSRTILGKEGAEQLLGAGDMLFMPGGSRVERVHGAFVDDDEVARVVDFLRAQGCPHYVESITADDSELAESGSNSNDPAADMYQQAVEIVIRDQKATISYLQRRLSIGYNRAATLIEQMEEEGIVSPANRAGKREILMDQ